MPRLYAKFRDTVLDLHDRGFWVVPCVGKKPHSVTDWANTRVDRVELERRIELDPSLDVAIVLSQSPYVDVECDSPEAEQELLDLLGEIPPTPAWESTRGKHYLFLRPEGLPDKPKAYVGAIEVRIGNKPALSLVPPSAGRKWLPGRSLDEVEPAPLPAALDEKLRQPAAAPTPPASGEMVAEGKRNDTMFQKAMALVALGLPVATVEATLLDLNPRVCSPPLPDAEVLAIAASASKGGNAKESLLDRILEGVELWRDLNDEPHMTVETNGRRENSRIGKRVRSFRRWISRRAYDLTKSTLSENELAEIAGMMEGRACFEGIQFPTWRRTAELGDKCYVDLCDDLWRAIEVDASGWRLIDQPPVKFLRAKAMQALPEPQPPRDGETLKSLLLPFLNVREVQWPLVATWLVAALRPRGPYPMLKLVGEQGSGKTTKARILRKLIDPNAAPVRAEPRSPRDLMIAANNAWCICLDNLSNIPTDLSDGLCRLSTGGGLATRTLYSDEDETIFDAQRPMILTSIEDIATKPDLLDRCLIIELPTISSDKRRTERELWAAFDEAHPRILGALLDALSAAMARLPEIQSRQGVELSRLADFEQFGAAVERALGSADGEFASAYAANRADAQLIALESSPVVAAIIKMAAKGPIDETATDLLRKLAGYHLESRLPPGWPRTARVLSAIIRRVAANLRHIGITAEVTKIGNEKRWSIVSQFASTQSPQKKPPEPKPRPPLGENPYRLFRKGGA